MECFKAALRKTDTLGVNKFVVDCKINLKNYKLMISY